MKSQNPAQPDTPPASPASPANPIVAASPVATPTPVSPLSQSVSPPSTNRSQPPPVPDYELLRRIGGGSYGDVWLARSTTGVLRAVKIVHRSTFTDDRPFQREFEGIKKFEDISRSHPSQLALFHVGRGEGYFFYVMELAEDAAAVAEEKRGKGEREQIPSAPFPLLSDAPTESRPGLDVQSYVPRTLRHDLQTHTRLPAARVLELGLALSEALTHLHGNGLVHRDIKPSNIIFVGGRPKLADIGLVTDTSDARSIVGTEGYLPPEGPGTPAGDIFAFGKVLYEALTGLDRRQFPELPADLRQWPDAALALELNAILVKACTADTRHRYRTAEEVHADLALLQQGESVTRQRRLERRFALGRKIGVAAMALAVLVAGFYFSIATLNRRPAGEQRSSPSELAAMEGTKNLEAYKKYVQGRTAMRQRNRVGIRECLNLMTEAVELDPSFVRAWGELFINHVHGRWKYADARAQTRLIAKKLEELNPNSAEAHFAKAWIAVPDFEFAKADKEFQLAIQLDPSRPYAHSLYAAQLISSGRLQEARKQLGECENLDPGFWLVPDLLGSCFFIERNYPEALAQYERALSLARQNIGAYERLGELYEANHQILDAIDAFQKRAEFNDEDREKIAKRYDGLRQAFRAEGERSYWLKRLEQAKAELTPELEPYAFAVLHARLGHEDLALALLGQAWQIKDFGLRRLILDQCWDDLRDNDRFKELLKKMGYRIDWPVR